MKKEDLKRYLDKQISDKEQNTFEQEMAENPFLSEAVEGLEEWKKQHNADFGQLDEELSSAITATIESKEYDVKKVVKMPIVKIIAVAASIIGILFFTVIFLYQQRISTDKLFEENFKALTHPDGAVRGETDNTDSLNGEKKAIYYYERENYKEAITQYEKIIKEHPENEKAQLFLAIAYLANYQPENAVQTLANNDFVNSKYKQDRDWYLALAYLKNKDLKNAKLLFERLSQEDNYYQISSKKLLKSLEGKVI